MFSTSFFFLLISIPFACGVFFSIITFDFYVPFLAGFRQTSSVSWIFGQATYRIIVVIHLVSNWFFNLDYCLCRVSIPIASIHLCGLTSKRNLMISYGSSSDVIYTQFYLILIDSPSISLSLPPSQYILGYVIFTRYSILWRKYKSQI